MLCEFISRSVFMFGSPASFVFKLTFTGEINLEAQIKCNKIHQKKKKIRSYIPELISISFLKEVHNNSAHYHKGDCSKNP